MGKEMGLGMILRDTITGFEGVAISRHDYMNGCVRFSLQPTCCKDDGTMLEPQTFDVDQLEVVRAETQWTERLGILEKGIAEGKAQAGKAQGPGPGPSGPGGPYDTPKRTAVPER